MTTETRKERITIRVTVEELKRLQRAALKESRKLSDYVRVIILRKEVAK